jgi:hypothetical protein
MQTQGAFTVRIYPADEQRVFLNKTLGCCFLYNNMLNKRIKTYESLKDKREVLYAHIKTKKAAAFRQGLLTK